MEGIATTRWSSPEDYGEKLLKAGKNQERKTPNWKLSLKKSSAVPSKKEGKTRIMLVMTLAFISVCGFE